MSIREETLAAFTEHFGGQPAFLVRGPGRVNVIGEHTDYNDGFVMPMAIDRAVWIALRPRADRRVRLHWLDYEQEDDIALDGMKRAKATPAEYVKGMAWALKEAGYELRGWEGVVRGDVPIGAGLSSSAALEMATARAFAAISGFEWDAATMARLGQKAENGWVGVNSGIMDQMISAGGEAGKALLIDCRTLESEGLPLPKATVIVVMDTDTRRGLVDSAYNERREQCEAAAAHFEVSALRDVSIMTFNQRADELDTVTRKRAKHVITENERVKLARMAMLRNDATNLGRLMNASHESLRDDFEVSSDALNVMVEHAQKYPACYGARMTGAGFGGCAVALVRADKAEEFSETVGAAYQEATGRHPKLYICEASAGASLEPVE